MADILETRPNQTSNQPTDQPTNLIRSTKIKLPLYSGAGKTRTTRSLKMISLFWSSAFFAFSFLVSKRCGMRVSGSLDGSVPWENKRKVDDSCRSLLCLGWRATSLSELLARGGNAEATTGSFLASWELQVSYKKCPINGTLHFILIGRYMVWTQNIIVVAPETFKIGTAKSRGVCRAAAFELCGLLPLYSALDLGSVNPPRRQNVTQKRRHPRNHGWSKKMCNCQND